MSSSAFMELAPLDITGESGDEKYGQKSAYGMFEIFSLEFTETPEDKTAAAFRTLASNSKPQDQRSMQLAAAALALQQRSQSQSTATDSATKKGTITITKSIDYASPDLFRYCVNKGKLEIPWAIISVREAGEESEYPWLRIELQTVQVHDFRWSLDPGAGGEKAETVTFEFQKILIFYYQQEAAGTHMPKKTAGFNYNDQNDKVDPIPT